MRILIFLLWVFLSFSVEGFIVEELNVTQGSNFTREVKRKIYITENALITEYENEYIVQKIENGEPKIYRILKDKKVYLDASSSAPLFIVTLPFLECERRICKIDKNSFKPTDEFKKIRGYLSRKVVIIAKFSGRKEEIIQWYTKEWKELIEANEIENKFYVNFIRAIMKNENLTEKNIPIRKLERFLKEITNKFGGVIRTEQEIQLIKTYSEVISVKKGNIPEYVYRLPKGYKKLR